jgi:hypothetical protein
MSDKAKAPAISVIHAPAGPEENAPSKPMIRDDRVSKLIEVPQLPNQDSIGSLIAATGLEELTTPMSVEAVKPGAGNKATFVFEFGLCFDGFAVVGLESFVFSYALVDEEGQEPFYEPRIIGFQRDASPESLRITLISVVNSLVAQRNALGEQLVSARRLAQAEKQSLMQDARRTSIELATFRDLANKNRLLSEAANARLNVVTAGFDTLAHALRLYAGEGSWQALEGEEVNRVLIGNTNGFELANSVLSDVIVKELLSA